MHSCMYVQADRPSSQEHRQQATLNMRAAWRLDLPTEWLTHRQQATLNMRAAWRLDPAN